MVRDIQQSCIFFLIFLRTKNLMFKKYIFFQGTEIIEPLKKKIFFESIKIFILKYLFKKKRFKANKSKTGY